MTKFFKILTCSCLFAVLAGPRLHAEGKESGKMKASALKVEMIQSEEFKLPAEFQVALYENLIQQWGKGLPFCMFIVMATATPPMLPASLFCRARFADSSREARRSDRSQLSPAQPQLRFIAGSPTATAKYCWRRM